VKIGDYFGALATMHMAGFRGKRSDRRGRMFLLPPQNGDKKGWSGPPEGKIVNDRRAMHIGLGMTEMFAVAAHR
jgi:hypothetical protein